MKLYVLLSLILLASCVPMRKYEEMKAENGEYIEANKKLKDNCRILEEDGRENKALAERLKKENADFNDKISGLRADNNILKEQIKRLKDSYANFSDASSSGSEEIQALLRKIKNANSELIERENRLIELERSRKLEQAKLQELQDALNRKDAAVRALKDKINKALLGFKNKGLSVKVKNGKVYVSMDNKLLFKSGSWLVDQRGRQALNKLAAVLAKNKDINVLVEGHTDNVPYRGKTQIKDNWDLSVKRSTSIIRILLQNRGIEGSRLTAAGRSKYCPVAKNNSSTARAKNRRTEIILTPKLDEVFKILDAQ